MRHWLSIIANQKNIPFKNHTVLQRIRYEGGRVSMKHTERCGSMHLDSERRAGREFKMYRCYFLCWGWTWETVNGQPGLCSSLPPPPCFTSHSSRLLKDGSGHLIWVIQPHSYGSLACSSCPWSPPSESSACILFPTLVTKTIQAGSPWVWAQHSHCRPLIRWCWPC